MQRLGRVLHVSQNRNIIIKIKNIPKIGAKVVDENLRPIGRVFDILGPISSPYASIKPEIPETSGMEEKILYVLPTKWRKRKSR